MYIHVQQWGAVLTRYNITWYSIRDCIEWGQYTHTIKVLTHKRHPISRLNRRAMGCILWWFWRKRHRTVLHVLLYSMHILRSTCGSAVLQAVTRYIFNKRNPILMMSSNGNIFSVTGLLCVEFPVTGEFPAQRPVKNSFDVFFELRPNKRAVEIMVRL